MTQPITQADIAACESERLLKLWHNRYYDEFDRMQSEVEAAKIMGHYAASFARLEGALTAVSITMKHIERRMIQIGGPVIVTRSKARSRTFRELQERVATLKAENEALRAALDERRAA